MVGQTIGLVDIETSHAAAWIPLLRALGLEITGLYDSGHRYTPHAIADFAKEHGIRDVFGRLEDMATSVDIGIVLSCNWDVHVARSYPFLEQNKPVLIDKPVVGSVADMQILQTWQQQGRLIAGGSSLRFATELAQFGEQLQLGTGTIDRVYATCYGHPFYYGVHLTTLLQALLGPNMESVRCVKVDPWIAEIRWQTGVVGVIELRTHPTKVPFSLEVYRKDEITSVSITDIPKVYAGFLRRVFTSLREGREPVPLSELLQAELACLAALQSNRNGGRWVELHELTVKSPSFDGTSFLEQYLAGV